MSLLRSNRDGEHNARLIAVLCGSAMPSAFYIPVDLQTPLCSNAITNECNPNSLFRDWIGEEWNDWSWDFIKSLNVQVKVCKPNVFNVNIIFGGLMSLAYTWIEKVKMRKRDWNILRYSHLIVIHSHVTKHSLWVKWSPGKVAPEHTTSSTTE